MCNLINTHTHTHTHGSMALLSYIITIIPYLITYYIGFGLFGVQYNAGLLSDITLLTQCYYHRGTRLNAI